jgi:hypothetical protein
MPARRASALLEDVPILDWKHALYREISYILGPSNRIVLRRA